MQPLLFGNIRRADNDDSDHIHTFISFYEVRSSNIRLPAFDIGRYSISKGFREQALNDGSLWKTK